MSIFSERLRELREQKSLSMASLARQIGVSDAAVCKWENSTNEPKASYISILANFFEVSTDYLLGLEDDTKFYVPELNFSATDKAQGVGIHGTKLSNEEWEVVELFSELKRAKGEKAVRAVIAMIQTLISS